MDTDPVVQQVKVILCQNKAAELLRVHQGAVAVHVAPDSIGGILAGQPRITGHSDRASTDNAHAVGLCHPQSRLAEQQLDLGLSLGNIGLRLGRLTRGRLGLDTVGHGLGQGGLNRGRCRSTRRVTVAPALTLTGYGDRGGSRVGNAGIRLAGLVVGAAASTQRECQQQYNAHGEPRYCSSVH